MRKIFLCTMLLAAAMLGLSAGFQCGEDHSTVTSQCGNCQTVVNCDGTFVEKCGGDKPFCVEATAKETDAKCGKVDDANPGCKCVDGNEMCDPYDGTVRAVCTDDATYAGPWPCPSGEFCVPHTYRSATCEKEQAPSPCDGEKDGVHTYDDACNSYVYCFGEEVAVSGSCDEGEVFDVTMGDNGHCVTLPVASCTGCKNRLCGNPYNCSVWDLCVNGISYDSNSCFGDKPYVDYETGECTDDESKCHPLTNCDLGPEPPIKLPMHPSISIIPPTTTTATTSTTTPTTTTAKTSTITPTTKTSTTTTTTTTTAPPTTPLPFTTPPSSACNEATVYDMWADPESKDCKGYYQCQITPSYTYKMVRGTCPNLLHFNADPAVRKCDLEENVTCQN